MRPALLVLLAVDGVLSAIVGALFLPLYVGSVPLPVSALVSGLVNAVLVWAATQWTSAPRLAAVPLWAFLLTVIVLTVGGPGGDIVFGTGSVADFLRLVLFVALGAAPAVLVLRRHARPRR